MSADQQGPPHRRSPPECAWCFEPLGDCAVELNGGFGHPGCVEYVWHAIEGPGALPWRPHRQFYRVAPAFLERLGCEAARLGIDPTKLATAVARASHG